MNYGYTNKGSAEELNFTRSILKETGILRVERMGIFGPDKETVTTKDPKSIEDSILSHLDQDDDEEMDTGPCGSVNRIVLLANRLVKRMPKDSSQEE